MARIPNTRMPRWSPGGARAAEMEIIVSHAEDHESTRRDFLYFATAGAGVVTVGIFANRPADVLILSTPQGARTVYSK